MSSSSRSDGGDDERGLVVDRALLELLIARHGAPRPAPPLSPQDRERQYLVSRRDRALAAVDPGFMRHLERHERDASTLSRAAARKAAPASPWETSRPSRFDLDVWRVRDPAQVREIDPGEEIFDLMEHRTPQAVLRDLHRPVQFFGDVVMRRVQSPTAGSLTRAREAVRDAMAQRAGRAAHVTLASALAAEGIAELAAILDRPWEESRPANPLPMPSRAPSAEDLQWFGLSGGYDPDL